jgi:hypothetical protein
MTAGLCVLAALAGCNRKPQEQALASSAAPASAAPAAPAANVQPQLTGGKVQSASATELTISANDAPATFELSPQTTIMVAHKGTTADIKAGDFIGTTNVPSADGTGQSTEVHIFPPGVKMGEGDRPMPAAPSAPASRMTNGTVSASQPASGAATSRMTNGSVGGVSKAPAGIEMDVAYQGGQRHIVVPPNTPVMVMSAGTPALLKPGTQVLVGHVPGANGAKDATFINVQP